MSVKKLAEAMGELSRAAKSGHAPPELLDDVPGLMHTQRVLDDAMDAGLHAAAREPADRARKAGDAGRFAERAEAKVRAAADGSATTQSLLRRIAKHARQRDLDELWGRFAPRDRTRLIDEMIRRADEGKEVDHNFVAGALREMVAKDLGAIRRLVIEERMRIPDTARSEPYTAFLDTGAMGDVHLRTKVIDEGGRSIELGTDRILGIGRGKPERVEVTWPSGDVETVTVHGVLEVTVAIEVKGRTVVSGGIRQLEALVSQGRGTGGYVMIDGKFWLLDYDPSKVKHVLVAPKKHPDFARAAKMSKLQSGGSLGVVEIPLDLDDEVLKMAGALLRALEEDPIVQKLVAARKAAVAQSPTAPKRPSRR